MDIDLKFTAEDALLCIQRELYNGDATIPPEIVCQRIDAILDVYLDQFTQFVKEDAPC